MKKLLLTVFVASAISIAASAQQPAQKDMKNEKTEWEKKIKDELKLTDEQVVKYDAVNKEFGEKMSAISSDATLTQDAQKEKKMALKKEKQARLFEFFTPEQQARYTEMMEKKKKETDPKPAGS